METGKRSREDTKEFTTVNGPAEITNPLHKYFEVKTINIFGNCTRNYLTLPELYIEDLLAGDRYHEQPEQANLRWLAVAAQIEGLMYCLSELDPFLAMVMFGLHKLPGLHLFEGYIEVRFGSYSCIAWWVREMNRFL